MTGLPPKTTAEPRINRVHVLMVVNLLSRLVPPYRRNLVFAVAGAHVLLFAIVLAIHQTFWLLSTHIFPTAYQMFEDTHRRQPDFAWNRTDMRQLDRYQWRLAASWTLACVCIGLSMLCIIPLFCTAEVAEGKEINLCLRQPFIAQLLTPLLVLADFLLAANLFTEWVDVPADDSLFHRLFNGAIKEEGYLTSFEQNLNCLSDEDIEGFDVWKCDRIIERAMLSTSFLTPLMCAQLALAIFSVLGCLFYNDREKVLRELCHLSKEEEGGNNGDD